MRPAAVLLSCFWLAACAPAMRPAGPTPEAPSDFPAAYYLQAAARGEPVFRIEPERSLVVVRVYRGGRLARFGHDHVVASRDVRGYVRLGPETASARADLYAPLALLTVDEPALRAEAGFDTQPSQRDIEGTRRNMLEKVLEVERFPFVMLYLEPAAAGDPVTTVNAAVTLHGTTRVLPITAELDRPSAEILYVRGRFSLNQTDFGIAPFAVLGGALQVQDRVDIEFKLSAARVTRADVPAARQLRVPSPLAGGRDVAGAKVTETCRKYHDRGLAPSLQRDAAECHLCPCRP